MNRWIIAIAISGLALATTKREMKDSSTPPPPPPGPPRGGCAYPPPGQPIQKTPKELETRVRSIIEAHNIGVSQRAVDKWAYNGRTYAAQLAFSLFVAAGQFGVPLDILVALCRRESDFNYWLGRAHVANQLQGVNGCPRPWPTEGGKAKGLAIGPLQVKPVAACQVGIDFSRLNSYSDDEMRLLVAVQAGAKYLAWTRDQLPGRPWCDVLHAYYCGVAGFNAGCRNNNYVNQIMAWAREYSELRRPGIN